MLTVIFQAERGDLGQPQLWLIVQCDRLGRQYRILVDPEAITGIGKSWREDGIRLPIEWRGQTGAVNLGRVISRCVISRPPGTSVRRVISQVIAKSSGSQFRVTLEEVRSIIFPWWHWRRLFAGVIRFWRVWSFPYQVNRHGLDRLVFETMQRMLPGQGVEWEQIIITKGN